MTSAKQIAANQANAKKSTGPKPESWEKTKMNALRHGLTGQVNLMPDEDREAHDKFCAAIVESLAPEGALEIQFSQAIAEDNWRMNRGRAIETNMFAVGNIGTGTDFGHPEINAAANAAQNFADNPQKFQLLSLYMQRTNRDMQKSLDRLTALQSERKARRQLALEEAAALYELEQHKRHAENRHMSRGQALSPQQPDQRREIEASGFVFSIHQIHAFAQRKRQLAAAKTAASTNHTHRQGIHKTRKREFARAA
jgi:hypothetical protein